MVWFFARDGETVRLETRYDDVSREYVLEITWPGRASETERFADIEVFRARVEMLESELDAKRWVQAGGPAILPHGWRGPFTN